MFKSAFLCALAVPFSLFSFLSVREMTLEEKVGQILMVHFQGEEINEEAKVLVQELGIGSIIYYNWANGLHSPEQVLSLSVGLQQLTRENRVPIPLFIAVDQEGGLVARLTQGFTVFPGNFALGMTEEPHLAEQCAFAMGQELRAVGVNFNLSPVVDVNSNPKNPIIGIRSFGQTPEKVCQFARKALAGYRKAGVLTCLKHFPGHGEVEVDSHVDLPVVNKTKEELFSFEWLPFRQLAAKADTVMTAHLMVPSIDPFRCATLSKPLLDLLRKEIGFSGVILTDSLVMEGVLKNGYSVDEAAILAFQAGCDLLLLGGKQLIEGKKVELDVSDIRRIHQNLVQAVKEGRISKEKLDMSVERILKLKKRSLFFLEPKPVIPFEEHRLLAAKIASLALRSAGDPSSWKQFPGDQKTAVFVPAILKETIKRTSLLQISKDIEPTFYSLSLTDEEIKQACLYAMAAEKLIFCSYNAWKSPSQQNLIQFFIESGKPMILIALRDPLDASLFPQIPLSYTTFSPTAPAIEAVCRQLCEIR